MDPHLTHHQFARSTFPPGGSPESPIRKGQCGLKLSSRRFPLGIPGLWQHKRVHSSPLLCSPKASQCPSLRPEDNREGPLGFQESLSSLEPRAPAETVGPEEAPGGSLWDAVRTTASSGGAPTPRQGTEVQGLGNAGRALFLAQGLPRWRAPGTWEVLGSGPTEDGHVAVRSAWGRAVESQTVHQSLPACPSQGSRLQTPKTLPGPSQSHGE